MKWLQQHLYQTRRKRSKSAAHMEKELSKMSRPEFSSAFSPCAAIS